MWAIIWALVIFLLYAIPGGDLPSVDLWDMLNFDKVAHFMVFALLVVFLSVGFKKQHTVRILYENTRKWAFLLGILYGGVLELLQGMLFADRTSDILDFIANATGVVVGLVIFRLVYGKKNM